MKRFMGILLFLVLITQMIAIADVSENARRYQQATELMEIGDYGTAAYIFDSLGDYRDSAWMADLARQKAGSSASIEKNQLKPTPTSTPRPKPTPTPTPTPTPKPTPTSTPAKKSLRTGETVVLGRYEQDGNTRNGDEPIEWMVIAVEEDRALLLSVYGLDTKPYNTNRTNTTWAECSLRRWLNGDFLYAAFSEREADQIQSANVWAEPNPYYPRVPSGEDTFDKVFLLSVNELEAYLPYEKQRFCLPTRYALDRGAHENNKTGRCRWWLRSPGEDSKHAANVFTSGEYWDDYFKVDSSGLTVRPAIWISM